MGLTAVAILVLAAAPQVEVSTLAGAKSSGEFQSLTADAIKLKDKSGKQTSVPIAEVMQANFAKVSTAKRAPYAVALVDGTVLYCTQITADSRAKTAIVDSPVFGTLKLPLTSVSNIRFAAVNQKYEKKWQEAADAERASASPPARTSWGGISCVMSPTSTSGALERITERTTPTNSSLCP